MRRPKSNKYLFRDGQSPEGMVSVSQIQTYMACPMKWKYGYIENIVPRVERPYLTIGKLCHKGMQTAMEVLWEQQQATPSANPPSQRVLRDAALGAMKEDYDEYLQTVNWLDEELPDLDQTFADAVSVFSQALDEFDPYRYTVVSVMKDGEPVPALELHFVVPCKGSSKGLHGYIDAVLKDQETGCIWCTDYKFRKSLAPDEDEAFNVQNSVYCRACYLMGIPITGTMTWQHVNTPAAEPQLLKDGKVSRAKIKTTWRAFMTFCIENGQDPMEYKEEMQAKLGEIEWYRQTYEYRNPETVENIWKDCIEPAAKAIKAAFMEGASHTRHLYPWNCKMCQYQSLCQGELRGYDAEAIRLREYAPKSHGR